MTAITPQRFDYTAIPDIPGLQTGMPALPIILKYQERSLTIEGLVDSGSTVNVLPYDIGLQLGLEWETQQVPVPLHGNLQDASAYGVVLSGQVNPFPELPLVFAWTQIPRPRSRLLLGQMNFFQHFDVWFSGIQQTFVLTLAKKAPQEH
jgi:hypothetical protein